MVTAAALAGKPSCCESASAGLEHAHACGGGWVGRAACYRLQVMGFRLCWRAWCAERKQHGGAAERAGRQQQAGRGKAAGRVGERADKRRPRKRPQTAHSLDQRKACAPQAGPAVSRLLFTNLFAALVATFAMARLIHAVQLRRLCQRLDARRSIKCCHARPWETCSQASKWPRAGARQASGPGLTTPAQHAHRVPEAAVVPLRKAAGQDSSGPCTDQTPICRAAALESCDIEDKNVICTWPLDVYLITS